MFDHNELFYEKLEWNCKLDAMWEGYKEDDEDDEDDEDW